MSINFLHFYFRKPGYQGIPAPQHGECRALPKARMLPRGATNRIQPAAFPGHAHHVVGAFRRFRLARYTCQNDRLRTRREPAATRAAHNTDTATHVSVKYRNTLAGTFVEPAQVEAPGTGKASAHGNLARTQELTLPRADKAGNAANTGWSGRRSCAGASARYQDLQVKRLKKDASGYFLTISHVCMGRRASVQWAL